MFDIQAKRIHEYKRQHLNLLHVITLYNRIRRSPSNAHPRRTVIFAGKSAPNYTMAKLIIKLINSLADVVNNDPVVREQLKVVFLPNFNVKNAHALYPAANLSEQISTAGKEASGTGNMKFAMNGALTIGTLDGANIEIREAVGAENFFLFGLTAEDVQRIVREGYRPREIYEREPELREALDQIRGGVFSDGDIEVFRPLVDSLIDHDPYLVLADYAAYIRCQADVERAYHDVPHWTRDVDPECRSHGQVFIRPGSAGVLRKHLESLRRTRGERPRPGAAWGAELGRRQDACDRRKTASIRNPPGPDDVAESVRFSRNQVRAVRTSNPRPPPRAGQRNPRWM